MLRSCEKLVIDFDFFSYKVSNSRNKNSKLFEFMSKNSKVSNCFSQKNDCFIFHATTFLLHWGGGGVLNFQTCIT